MDKSIGITHTLLGTEPPTFFSLQLFDTWIKDFNASEDLNQLVGMGQRSKEHSTLFTMILETSYSNGTINPSLVAGRRTLTLAGSSLSRIRPRSRAG